MRPASPTAFAAAVLAAALVTLFSCATGPVVIPPDLSAAEIFQRAQDASDRGDFALGMRYYEMVPIAHPDDVLHMTWASYEIAFLYHKMGKNDTALTLITALLDRYTTEGDKLPPAPHVLASKLKVRLESLLPKKPQ